MIIILNFIVCSPFQNMIFIRIHQCNDVALRAFSIDENLINKMMSWIDSFKFLRSDVFTLTEFKKILLSIDDFQLISFENFTNIACIEPSVFYDFMSQFLVSKIPSCYDWSFDQNFSLFILGSIVHFRDIN